MVRPTAERVLSRLWRCCSIGLIATAALAQLILLDPGEPATAALLPAEAMEECLRAALASPLALLLRAQRCRRGSADRGHDLDATPEPSSAVFDVELCISSSQHETSWMIVMMNFQ